MKRFFAIFLSLALFLTAFVGCDTEESPYVPTGDGLGENVTVPPVTKPQTQEQNFSLAYDPGASLNPYKTTSATNRVLFTLLYQGLFTVDRNYKVYPMLCKEYNVSADMKTYTFHIASAYFSNGTPLTAADVAASLEAARNSGWYAGRLQHVDTIETYGDTVVVNLKIPMENLPILLDIPIVRASQVESDAPLGTGPYRLAEEALERQIAWWCNAKLAVTCATIPLVKATNPIEIRDAFEYSGAGAVVADPSHRDRVDYHSDYELWECESGLFLYLACNAKSKILKNDTLRAALTHAIDRDRLVDLYYAGFARSAQLPASPQSPYYIPSLAVNYGYDPKEFQQAVEKANLSDNAITLLVNGDDDTRVKVAYAIAAMLDAGGLKVTVKESAAGKFADELKKGKYDLYLAQTRLAPNMDLSSFFGTDTPLNYGGLSSPGIYTMSQEALANAGNYYTLYEMIMDDGLLCPILFQSYAVYGCRGTFSQLDPTRDHIFFYHLGRTLEDALISG